MEAPDVLATLCLILSAESLVEDRPGAALVFGALAIGTLAVTGNALERSKRRERIKRGAHLRLLTTGEPT